MKKNFIYVFLHVPKTAGMTIDKHILENFEPGEQVSFSFDDLSFNGIENTADDYLARTNEYFSRYSKSELKKVKVIYSHQVPYGIHEIFNKPCRYICLIRKPNDRSVSYYNFFRTRYERETFLNKKQD